MKSNVGNPILVICFCATIFISCNRQTELEGPWLGCEIRKPLLDLKEAKDQGAISDQEYNEMKEKLKRTDKCQSMNLNKVD
jgi:hypothetical protein